MNNLKKYQNKVIAHRGIHNNKDVPENSIKSFKLAKEKKYPIELDIHLTKDNQLIVFHDDNLKRMTKENKIIENLTLAEIKKYKLLNTNEQIPTLKEVLNLINGKVLLDIEIKGKKRIKILINQLIDELKNYNGEIIIKSFNPIIVKRLKQKTTKYPIGLLISHNTDSKLYNTIAKTNLIIPYSSPDFIALDKKLLTKKRIKKYLSKYQIFIWTIKQQTEIKNINNKNYIYICNNLI